MKTLLLLLLPFLTFAQTSISNTAIWDLKGNVVTNNNYFLGTKNAYPLIFKTNNQEAFKINVNKTLDFSGVSQTTLNSITPTAGRFVFNSTTNKFQYGNGSDWLNLSITNENRTFFVDELGNDNISKGNLKDYFLTIQKAIDSFTDDQDFKNIIVGVGTFDEILTIDKSKVYIKGVGTKKRVQTALKKAVTVNGDNITIENITLSLANAVITLNGTNSVLNNIQANTLSAAIPIVVSNDKTKGWISFDNLDFGGRTINLPNLLNFNPLLDTPRVVYINNCDNTVFTVGIGWIIMKYNSPTCSTTVDTSSYLLDLDSKKPTAYSLIRQLSFLGQSTKITKGTLVYNDDNIDPDYKVYSCKTEYTVPSSIGVGTPIDKTKYNKYASGEVIQSRVYFGTEALGFSSNEFSFALTPIKTIQPKSTNSKIVITIDCDYEIKGHAEDEFEVYITPQSNINNTLFRKYQRFRNALGGSTRGGVMFPLQYIFNNTSLAEVKLNISVRKNFGDDNLVIFPSRSLKIEEIEN